MSIVMEAALSVFLDRLVDGLLQLLDNRDFFAKEKKKAIKQLNDWKETLPVLCQVLGYAHENKSVNPLIEKWLKDLENLAYDTEDALVHFNSALMLRRKQKTRMFCYNLLTLGRTPSTKLYYLVDSITRRLQQINTQKESLNLLPGHAMIMNVPPNRHAEGPSELEVEADVYGRDEEKREIIDFLNKHEVGVAVYPVVGMGGVGKTTLARYAYKHGNFDVKAWISVSEGYDRGRIYKSIVTYIEKVCFVTDRNALHKKVEEVLGGKKFLLVLDDLWEISIREWGSLGAPFLKGRAGSKIIVTTRNSDVADTVRTVNSYATLHVLLYEDCWKIFSRCACLGDNETWKQDIGSAIVKKCHGLPLAVRLIGSLLRWKDMDVWKSILENKMMDEIKTVLKLSFDDLSYDSKNCFLCCAMSAGSGWFNMKGWVHLWMLLDLVTCYEDGCRCFHELVSRSLLLKGELEAYNMHDLVRDMGNEISGDKFCAWEKKIGSIEKARHLHLGRPLFAEMVEMVKRAKKDILPLRMITITYDSDNPLIWKKNDLSVVFQKLINLRFLSLPSCNLPELPKSVCEMILLKHLDLSHWDELRRLPSTIGNLVNLFHLDISKSKLELLPPEIGNLSNLWTLDLRWCKMLKVVPSEIGKLANLAKLNLSNCKQLERLPPEIGNLTNLLFLDLSCCRQLKIIPPEIGKLAKLGFLDLSNCEQLETLPPEIWNLTNLDFLDLSCCRQLKIIPPGLGNLTNLGSLFLSGCSEVMILLPEIGKLVNLEIIFLPDKLKVLPLEIRELLNLRIEMSKDISVARCIHFSDLYNDKCSMEFLICVAHEP